MARERLESMAATSSGPYNLSQSALAKFPVPLPPLHEACRAQLSVDGALSIGMAAQQGGEATLARCSRLRQSILEWAFEGKLVDQDPNDESARKLLERIRAERESASGPSGKAGKQRRSSKKPQQRSEKRHKHVR